MRVCGSLTECIGDIRITTPRWKGLPWKWGRVTGNTEHSSAG